MAGVISSVFKQMVSASQIEDAVIFTLQKWYSTYLAEQARQLSISPTLLPAPQNYTNRNSFDAEQGEKIPKVVVLAPGLLDTPIHDGSGFYRAMWRLGVGVATAAKDEQSSNMLVKAYGAATRGIVLNKAAKESRAMGLTVIEVAWIEEDYPDIPIPSQHMLYKAASLYFSFDVDNVASRYGGPEFPGTGAPTEFGEVQTVDIDLQLKGINEEV